MGAGFGGRSGLLESIEGPGHCSRWCSGGQADMGEDLGNHGGMLDGGDELQGAPALAAVFHIDLDTRLSSRAQLARRRGRGHLTVVRLGGIGVDRHVRNDVGT